MVDKLLNRFWYETEPAVKPDCSGTILCECDRRSCPGKTVKIETWRRKMRQFDTE